jgi:ATP-dependent helicase HrpA
MLKEKVQALARGIPQRLRHKLGPLEPFAARFAASVPPSDMPLATALSRFIREEFNLDVPVDAFRPDSAPVHLQMSFRVVDADGRQLGMGRSLAELRRELAREADTALRADAPAFESERHTDWTFGDLAEVMEVRRSGQTLIGYPAIRDCGESVMLDVSESPDSARALHRAGVRRLLAIAYRERIREIEKSVTKDMTLASLKGDLVIAALDRTFLADSLPMTQAHYARRVQEGRSRFNLIAQELQRLAVTVLAEQQQVVKRLNGAQKAFPDAVADVRRQCDALLASGWLARIPWERLQHLPRYLRAAALRLDKLRADPARDRQRAAEMSGLEQNYRRELALRAKLGTLTPELEQFGWLLEELRVSLFAQELKTPVPVSVKRLAKLWQSMRV